MRLLLRGLALFWVMAAAYGGGQIARGEPPPTGPAATADSVPLEEEVARLIVRLDSDTFAEREGAMQRLREIGQPALAALHGAAEHRSTEVRRRAQMLVRELILGPRRREIAAFCALPDEQLDVERGMWLIARIFNPQVKQQELSRQLDEIAAEVRTRLGKEIVPARAAPQALVAAMRQVLFVEYGFRGNAADYHNPDNGALDRVLATRKGQQIMLSHVCLGVARRLDVPIVAVPSSLNYIVKYDGSRAPPGFPKLDIYFHPYQQGKVLSREDRVREFPMHDPDRMVPPDTRRQALARMLRNLVTALEERRTYEHLKEVQEMLEWLRVNDPAPVPLRQ